ncbi:MAG: hypothetical protein V7678_12855 [Brevundimonas sp.]
MLRIVAAAVVALAAAACGNDQEAAGFERVEDRAEIENPNLEDTREPERDIDPGYRHEAPLHVDEDQEVAPPPPGDE